MSLKNLLETAGVTSQQKDIEITEELLIKDIDRYRELINY